MNETGKLFALAILLWIAGVACALLAAITSPVPTHEKLWVATTVFVISGIVTFIASIMIKEFSGEK